MLSFWISTSSVVGTGRPQFTTLPRKSRQHALAWKHSWAVCFWEMWVFFTVVHQQVKPRCQVKGCCGKEHLCTPCIPGKCKGECFFAPAKSTLFCIAEHRLERKTAQVILHRSGIIGNGKAKNPIPAWKKCFSAFLLTTSLYVSPVISMSPSLRKLKKWLLIPA